jgi:translation initiation factor 1 (eIF-1/SUI1)
MCDNDDFDQKECKRRNIVDIRIQQRTNKKFITTIAGLQGEFDHEKILRAIKKVLLF